MSMARIIQVADAIRERIGEQFPFLVVDAKFLDLREGVDLTRPKVSVLISGFNITPGAGLHEHTNTILVAYRRQANLDSPAWNECVLHVQDLMLALADDQASFAETRVKSIETTPLFSVEEANKGFFHGVIRVELNAFLDANDYEHDG